MANASTPVERVFLRIDEVAMRVGVSRAQAYRLIAQGEMPATRIGKCLRVHTEDFDVWCESKRALGAGR